MLQGALFTLAITLISVCAVAQPGSISGIVTDGKSGETIVGANVVIDGTTVGAATDIEGNFQIDNVKPGVYNLNVSFVTYKTHVIPDVVVESGRKTALRVTLVEDATELKEVVVTASREINTDYALLGAIRESKLVVSGISAEQ
ncbi:MAG TPA: carboxypeptidase-like regulatory domain-containing protein, partial [Ohtaekwangia sp.]|nr:carboxypeptidase-like regulatory domain-containing protein [Ohtaekwangia sp.]